MAQLRLTYPWKGCSGKRTATLRPACTCMNAMFSVCNLIFTQIERRPQKNGRRPQTKIKKMKDDLNKRMKMEDNLNFLLKNKNDNLNGRRPQKDENGRQPKKVEDDLKKMEEDLKRNRKKWKTTSKNERQPKQILKTI